MISLIFSVSPSSGSASLSWLHCQAGSLRVVGKMDFWHPQVTFLELVTLKNVTAHFPPVSFCKISWKVLIGSAIAQEMPCLDYLLTLDHRQLCTLVTLPGSRGPELWQKKITWLLQHIHVMCSMSFQGEPPQFPSQKLLI